MGIYWVASCTGILWGALHILNRCWGLWASHRHSTPLELSLFLITCPLYLWCMLQTRLSFLPKFSQPYHTCRPMSHQWHALPLLPTTHPVLAFFQIPWMPNTSEPQGPWTCYSHCLEDFSSNTDMTVHLHHSGLYSNTVSRGCLPWPADRKHPRGASTCPSFPFFLPCFIFLHGFYHLLTYFMFSFSCRLSLLGAPFYFPVSSATRTKPGTG